MEYRTLGGSGTQVSRYCLGAMMFGRAANPDHDECVGIVHAALDAGINFIDTSDAYSRGESDRRLGLMTGASSSGGDPCRATILTIFFFVLALARCLPVS